MPQSPVRLQCIRCLFVMYSAHVALSRADDSSPNVASVQESGDISVSPGNNQSLARENQMPSSSVTNVTLFTSTTEAASQVQTTETSLSVESEVLLNL